MLVGTPLGRLEGLLVDEQHRRAVVDLAVQQAHRVGGAGHLAQLAARLQVALQRGDGQAAGAGAHQVDVLAAGDRAAHVDRFLERLHIARQAPFAVPRIGVAPADHEHLQAVLQRVLDEALLGAEVEDVELVDLRRHDQQRLEVLLLAHRLVLDQLQHLVAEHHRAGGGGQVLADLEGLLVHLAGQAVVVQQVVVQVAQAAQQAAAAAVEQLLDRQRVEQAVGRRQRIAEQRGDEQRAGAVVGAEVAFVDPQGELFLPSQVGLQAASVEGVEAPARVGEAAVGGIGLVGGVADQHAAELAAEGQRVLGAVQRVLEALQGDAAHGGEQVAAT
ncbi:hypothetical protein D9M69_453760 [compost metagenome]